MSDFRFGANDYRMNIDFEHQAPDFCFGWDCVDWNGVEWVEIERVKYAKELTCTMHESIVTNDDGSFACIGYECSECKEILIRTMNYCPSCGARVEAVD